MIVLLTKDKDRYVAAGLVCRICLVVIDKIASGGPRLCQSCYKKQSKLSTKEAELSPTSLPL